LRIKFVHVKSSVIRRTPKAAELSRFIGLIRRQADEPALSHAHERLCASIDVVVVFTGGEGQGNLKVIRLRFNQPFREEALRPIFLEDKRYQAVGWPEIETWLRHED